MEVRGAIMLNQKVQHKRTHTHTHNRIGGGSRGDECQRMEERAAPSLGRVKREEGTGGGASGFPPTQHKTGKLGTSEEEPKHEIPPLGNHLGPSGQSQLVLNRRK